MNAYYITLPTSSKRSLYSLISGYPLWGTDEEIQHLNLKGAKTVISGIPFAWNSKPIYVGNSGCLPFVLESGKHDGLTLGFNTTRTGVNTPTKLSHIYIQGTSGDSLFMCF